jgi:hypothetical protein
MGGKCGEILGKGGSTKGGQQEGSMVGEVLMLAKCKMGKEGRFHGRKRGKVKGGIKQGGQALAKSQGLASLLYPTLNLSPLPSMEPSLFTHLALSQH